MVGLTLAFETEGYLHHGSAFGPGGEGCRESGVLTQVKGQEVPRAHQSSRCVYNVWSVGGMVFEEFEIERVAAEMVAEFGKNAERELRERSAQAKARGLGITASAWEQVLRCVEKLREDDDDRSGDLREAC